MTAVLPGTTIGMWAAAVFRAPRSPTSNAAMEAAKMAENSVAQKLCNICITVKALADFPYRKDRGVYESQCKRCTVARQSRWLKETRSKRYGILADLPPDATEQIRSQRETIITKLEKHKVQTASGCWEWPTKSGRYPQFSVAINGRWVKFGAHRIIAILFHGLEVASRLYSCHKCDNVFCWRPDHLFVGTSKDNHQDAKQKGRLRSGNLRYSKGDVLLVRKMATDGKTATQIAAANGMSSAYVRYIIKGRARASVT